MASRCCTAEPSRKITRLCWQETFTEKNPYAYTTEWFVHFPKPYISHSAVCPSGRRQTIESSLLLCPIFAISACCMGKATCSKQLARLVRAYCRQHIGLRSRYFLFLVCL